MRMPARESRTLHPLRQIARLQATIRFSRVECSRFFVLLAALFVVIAPRAAALPVDDWSYSPFAPTYEERRRASLEQCAADTRKSPLAAVSAALLGQPAELSDEVMNKELAFIDSREDCGDFTVTRYVRLMYADRKLGFLTEAQRAAIKKSLLNFKYWVDEPNPDKLISWTENHQILFHAAEYLAGQLWADEVFVNNGKTGAWHRDHARPLILQWINRRARWGFSEWDSNVYYNEDIPPLANLVEYADDPEVANPAAMALDLMLMDIGADLHRGAYVTSHGRSYLSSLLSARRDSIVATTRLVWGLGRERHGCSFGATSIASSMKYTPPEAIIAAGLDNSEEYENRERHGVTVEEAVAEGISTEEPANLPFFWGIGAYSHPETVSLTLRMANEWNLWDHPYLSDAKQARDLANMPNLKQFARTINIETHRTYLGAVNKIMYRTPDYALSSAQDYRKGEMGNQHHIWQASLNPDAVVFVTNPGVLADTDGSSDRPPDYWASQNRLPRIGQYKNVLVSLYKINMQKAMGERAVYDFTHAYFPREFFDEVTEEGGWFFGRAGDGYIALRSDRPAEWVADGPYANREIKAPGKKNVWILQLGRRAVDWDFERFRKSILAARLEIDGLNVRYEAPGVGTLEFSWDGPLKANGTEVPLSGYPRVDNPFMRSEFDSGVYRVNAGGRSLLLDFNTGAREMGKQ